MFKILMGPNFGFFVVVMKGNSSSGPTFYIGQRQANADFNDIRLW